jgi:hypothetical protein
VTSGCDCQRGPEEAAARRSKHRHSKQKIAQQRGERCPLVMLAVMTLCTSVQDRSLFIEAGNLRTDLEGALYFPARLAMTLGSFPS